MLMRMMMLQVCIEGGRRRIEVARGVCAVEVCTARSAADGPHPRDYGDIVVVPMVNAMDRRIKLSSTISAT